MTDTPISFADALTALRDGQAKGGITPATFRRVIASVLNVVPAQVSAAGTNQGTATVAQAQYNVITGGATGGGIMATAGYTRFWNDWSGAVLIYPIVGGQFGSNGVNMPVSIAPGSEGEFIMYTSTQGTFR